MTMADIMVLVITTIAGLSLHIWAEGRCTILDVQTGRRDSMALVDDYGSNRGWYWQYKIPSMIGVVMAAPGLLFFGIGALVFIASN